MIRLSESLQLAKTKFKTRKVRNSLSAITISLGIILILVALIGTNGILNVVTQAFMDSNSSRYFVRDTGHSQEFSGEKMMASPVKGENLLSNLTKEEYKNTVSGNIKTIFDEYLITDSSFKLSDNSSSSGVTELYAVDGTFVSDNLYKDFSFADEYDGKIPVVVPREHIYQLENTTVPASSKDQYDTLIALLDKYAGTPVTLNRISTGLGTEEGSDTMLNTEFVIVGFSVANPFAYSPLDTALVIPNWAINKNSELEGLFANSEKHFILELNSKKERNEFFQNNYPQRSVFPIQGKLEAVTEPVDVVRKVALGIGGFLLAISSLFVLSTLSKIVSDSKREIGVFRAIGGQRKDIRKIFFSYTFLLVTLGFVLGFVLAVLINTGASLRWGNDFFYAIAKFALSVNIPKPTFVFVQIPWLQVLALYGFVLLIGFVAAFFPVFRASRQDPIKALREE